MKYFKYGDEEIEYLKKRDEKLGREIDKIDFENLFYCCFPIFMGNI